MKRYYDLMIVGAGPAGFTAAIYAARYKIDVAVISKNMGGLAATAHKVCNFPSYDNVSGFELMQKIYNQVEKLAVPMVFDGVSFIGKTADGLFELHTDSGDRYIAKKVIFAAGTEHSSLGIPGESEFYGKGVSYCATCDGAFFKNKVVTVVGGSDAALTAALLLSEYADKVHIIYRKNQFTRAEPAWIELIKNNSKIDTFFNEEVVKINGEKSVQGLLLKSGNELHADGVFIEIGSKPHLESLSKLGINSENGYIITDQHQKTNVPGFFAAGDVTSSVFKQIITAASQGAVAAYGAYQELKLEERGLLDSGTGV